MPLYHHETATCSACNSHHNSNSGHAICDLQGALWEVDPDFIRIIQQNLPDSERGQLPPFVIAQLKNKGWYVSDRVRIKAFRNNARTFKLCASVT